MKKVYRKEGGSVHWVRASDVDVLLGSGLFRADQRYGKVVEEGETNKVSLNSVARCANLTGNS